ncbi:MAG: hypothetical protein R3C05_05680 [Pirellulaceae bacterium]
MSNTQPETNDSLFRRAIAGDEDALGELLQPLPTAAGCNGA